MSRILLVDDNPDVRHATEFLLQQWGHEVRLAGDGVSALFIARVWRPQVMLLDIGLPGMDGFTVAEYLRREALPTPRVIAISALYREGDDARLAAAGIDHLLRKPLDSSFLRSLLGTGASAAPP